MILDTRPTYDAPRPGPIVGFRGVAGSMLIHLTLLAAIVSYDAYLHTQQTRAGRGVAGADATAAANASGAPGSPASPAVVRAGDFGVGAERPNELPQPPAGAELTDARMRFVPRQGLALMLGTLGDHLWQSTVFAIAAALLALAFRRQQARIRYWLWFSASIKFLVPFTPLVALGSQLAWPAAIQNIAHHPIVSGIGEPFANINTSVASLLSALPFANSASAPASASVAASAAASVAASTQRDWLALALIVIWASGFAAIVSVRLRAWRQLRALLAASKPMELTGVEIPADVAVRSAPGLLEPGVIGWQRPVLLMPADIADHLAPQEIAAIVAHEVCHVRRQDNLTASVHMIAEALFWFHPAVWWIGARLVDERERACDEHVLQTVGEPRSYAQGILNICKRYVASPLASVSGVGSSNVKKRIDAILANRIGEAIGPWQRVILGTMIALVLIVPLGAGAVYAPRFAGQIREEMIFVPRGDSAARTPGSGPATRAAIAGVVLGVDNAPAADVAYALVVASPDRRLGPGLIPSPSADCDAATAAQPCGEGWINTGVIVAKRVTSAELAGMISSAMDRQVEDRTGLTGRFSCELTWTSETAGLSIFTAVREQLGLTLVPIGLANRGPREPATDR